MTKRARGNRNRPSKPQTPQRVPRSDSLREQITWDSMSCDSTPPSSCDRRANRQSRRAQPRRTPKNIPSPSLNKFCSREMVEVTYFCCTLVLFYCLYQVIRRRLPGRQFWYNIYLQVGTPCPDCTAQSVPKSEFKVKRSKQRALKLEGFRLLLPPARRLRHSSQRV